MKNLLESSSKMERTSIPPEFRFVHHFIWLPLKVNKISFELSKAPLFNFDDELFVHFGWWPVYLLSGICIDRLKSGRFRTPSGWNSGFRLSECETTTFLVAFDHKRLEQKFLKVSKKDLRNSNFDPKWTNPKWTNGSFPNPKYLFSSLDEWTATSPEQRFHMFNINFYSFLNPIH